jgi:hypothetical protein
MQRLIPPAATSAGFSLRGESMKKKETEMVEGVATASFHSAIIGSRKFGERIVCSRKHAEQLIAARLMELTPAPQQKPAGPQERKPAGPRENKGDAPAKKLSGAPRGIRSIGSRSSSAPGLTTASLSSAAVRLLF